MADYFGKHIGNDLWANDLVNKEAARLNTYKQADFADDLGYVPETPEESYIVSKTFEVVTQESAEQGDADSRGFEYHDEPMDRSDVVRELRRGGYIEPSASFLSGLRWVSTEAEQDYSDGSYTTYSLHIKNSNGQEISGQEWKSLLEEAGTWSSLHITGARKQSNSDIWDRLTPMQQEDAEAGYGEHGSWDQSHWDAVKRDYLPKDIRVDTWFERDRASVVVYQDGKEVAEWWDDDVRQMVEDGFLDPKDWKGSAIRYCEEMGLLHNASMRKAYGESVKLDRTDSRIDDVDNNTQTAHKDHIDDPGYHNILYSTTASFDGNPMNTERAIADHHVMGDKDEFFSGEPMHKQLGSGESKVGATLVYDECGTPPNTEKATQDHEYELKQLARQIAAMTSNKFNPNDPYKD